MQENVIDLKKDRVKIANGSEHQVEVYTDNQIETITGVDTVTAISLVRGISDIKRFCNADKLGRFVGIALVQLSRKRQG